MEIIRWIGAFGRANSLAEALDWELTQSSNEVAAEAIRRGDGWGHIRHARVGLRAGAGAVIRVWRRDVWSEICLSDWAEYRLRKTRRPGQVPVQSRHSEAWIRPGRYNAIVAKNFPALPYRVRRDISRAAKKYGLPIISILPNGRKKEVVPLDD